MSEGKADDVENEMEEIIDRKGAHQKMEIAHNLKSRKCHQNVLNVKSKFLFLVEKTEIILCNFFAMLFLASRRNFYIEGSFT